MYLGSNAEVIAGRLQDAGSPLKILYPGAVLGPDDPGLGEENRRLRDLLRGHYPVWPVEGYHGTDVRDVARAVGELMAPGAGPRRYLVPGHWLDGPTLLAALREVTGRRLPVDAPPGRRTPAEHPAVPGLVPRPLAVTLRDTVAWLHRRGQLTARQAGSAVGREPFLPGVSGALSSQRLAAASGRAS